MASQWTPKEVVTWLNGVRQRSSVTLIRFFLWCFLKKSGPSLKPLLLKLLQQPDSSVSWISGESWITSPEHWLLKIGSRRTHNDVCCSTKADLRVAAWCHGAFWLMKMTQEEETELIDWREREKKQGRKPDCELVMQKNKINVKKRILSTPWLWRWPQAWWSRFNVSQFWPPWLFSEERGRKICLATPQESLWIIFQRHPRESALCWLWSQVRKRAAIGLGCQYFWNAFKTNKKRSPKIGVRGDVERASQWTQIPSEVMNWVSKAIIAKKIKNILQSLQRFSLTLIHFFF